MWRWVWSCMVPCIRSFKTFNTSLLLFTIRTIPQSQTVDSFRSKSAFYPWSAVFSLHFYADHIKSQVDHIKSKNWSYQKLKVDNKKTWVDHIKSEKLTAQKVDPTIQKVKWVTEGILTGLTPHRVPFERKKQNKTFQAQKRNGNPQWQKEDWRSWTDNKWEEYMCKAVGWYTSTQNHWIEVQHPLPLDQVTLNMFLSVVKLNDTLNKPVHHKLAGEWFTRW